MYPTLKGGEFNPSFFVMNIVCVHMHKVCVCVLYMYVHIHTLYKSTQYSLEFLCSKKVEFLDTFFTKCHVFLARDNN